MKWVTLYDKNNWIEIALASSHYTPITPEVHSVYVIAVIHSLLIVLKSSVSSSIYHQILLLSLFHAVFQQEIHYFTMYLQCIFKIFSFSFFDLKAITFLSRYICKVGVWKCYSRIYWWIHTYNHTSIKLMCEIHKFQERVVYYRLL